MPPDHNLNDASPAVFAKTARGESERHGRPLRIGIGGPVGSGKTALVAALCRTLAAEYELAVVTNDIYTTEDADFLRLHAVLPDGRIEAVQTGCCPHTAIRDDISANLDAVELLEERHPDLDLLLVESGGDNLTATFSYGLVDAQVFVLDVAGGDKVPRKGGPGVTSADLLVVNKTDLALMVGADLGVMERDSAAVRAGRPTILLSLREDPSAAAVAAWVRATVDARLSVHAPTSAAGHCTSRNIDPPSGDVGRASDVAHPTSDVAHPTSDVAHPTSDDAPLASSAAQPPSVPTM